MSGDDPWEAGVCSARCTGEILEMASSRSKELCFQSRKVALSAMVARGKLLVCRSVRPSHSLLASAACRASGRSKLDCLLTFSFVPSGEIEPDLDTAAWEGVPPSSSRPVNPQPGTQPGRFSAAIAGRRTTQRRPLRGDGIRPRRAPRARGQQPFLLTLKISAVTRAETAASQVPNGIDQGLQVARIRVRPRARSQARRIKCRQDTWRLARLRIP